MLLQALVLGIVQGLTEFLPISSSAHLVLIPWLLKWEPHGLTFDVALHAGTALAVLFYFRKLWMSVIKGFLDSLREREIQGDDRRKLAWFIIVGTLPGAVAGALGEHAIEEHLRQPWVIAMALVLLALVLLVSERIGKKQRELHQINLGDCVWIGLSQALALIPGVSRSGITITTGLLRDLDRRSAAEFSFLLSAPIIAGAACKQSIHLVKHPLFSKADVLVFTVGVLASAVAGFLCIKFFLRYLQAKSLLPFVIYRIILGVVILFIYFA